MVEVGVEGKRGYPFPLLYADNKDYVGWERIYSLEKRPASIECTDDEVFSIRYESGEKTVLAIEGKRDGRLAARARGAALSGALNAGFLDNFFTCREGITIVAGVRTSVGFFPIG